VVVVASQEISASVYWKRRLKVSDDADYLRNLAIPFGAHVRAGIEEIADRIESSESKLEKEVEIGKKHARAHGDALVENARLTDRLDAIRKWADAWDGRLTSLNWDDLTALLTTESGRGIKKREPTAFEDFVDESAVEIPVQNCGHQHDMGFTCILPAAHEGMHRGDIVWSE
jgi:hypothetical protein